MEEEKITVEQVLRRLILVMTKSDIESLDDILRDIHREMPVASVKEYEAWTQLLLHISKLIWQVEDFKRRA